MFGTGNVAAANVGTIPAGRWRRIRTGRSRLSDHQKLPRLAGRVVHRRHADVRHGGRVGGAVPWWARLITGGLPWSHFWFYAGVRKPVDPRVREALGLAINRAAISNVLFQKRGIAASGLLPQWLTGYEFMFGGDTNLNRARELRADAAAFVVINPISLAYDFSDPLAKLVAERIAVDAREAGIVVQPYAESHINSKAARSSLNADAVLLRVPLQSLDPAVALAARVDDLGLFPENLPAVLGATRPEDLVEIERKMLGGFRVLPIAHIPQVLWLNNNAHNWQQLVNGTWQLDQLWVEGAR